MGKSKHRKRYGLPRPQPTGIVANLNEEEQSVTNGPSFVTLIDQLQSTEEECRLVACATVATIVADPLAIPVLLENNLVRILAPLLGDPNIYIQNSSVGALRNLSVDGGVAVCEKMVNSDVLTMVIGLLKMYEVGWEPSKLWDEKLAQLKTDTFIQAVHLLWNLCENSETAVQIFNKEKLAHPLVYCLNPSIYGYPLVLAVAHCLHTVTDSNPEVCTYLRNDEPLSQIQSLTTINTSSMDALLLRAVAAGLLVNVFGDQLSTASGHLVSPILSTIADVLAINTHEHLISEADKVVALQVTDVLDEAMMPMAEVSNGTTSEAGIEMLDVNNQTNGTTEKVEPTVDKTTEINKIIANAETFLKAQQLAVEIAANLCSEDDDYEVGSEESMSSDEVVCDVDMETNESSSVLPPCCLPSELHHCFVKFDILNHVLKKVECPPLSTSCPLNTPNKRIAKCLFQLRVHALLSAANMISSLSIETIGGIERLHSIWTGLVRMCHMKQDSEINCDVDYLEAVSSALSAVAQKFAECKTIKLADIMSPESMVLFEKMQESPNQQIRINSIRVLSSIGSTLLLNSSTHSELKPIGIALMNIACQDKSLHVVAEALDAIFDIFAEDEVDPVVKEINLIDNLKPVLSTLKGNAVVSRSQKQKYKDPVISTAKLNLIRFIKYKSSLGASTSQQTTESCNK
ncbi:HEAT repeat-containing protein 3 isoform X1 [Octopus sinensis]|uniref:HEAT repeat-containing protein 3 isoform X1 n=2 Tax=Octopus sinensis TaxID=2607531 RepID=A0A6P7SU87_9MOLL|nr:HEAT repeat-containing protein 3 isoform X1 [Octopus sinensis]